MSEPIPLVVQYLCLREDGGTLPPHPSVRTSSPIRYLECAVTQAASLRLQQARCDLALATNVSDRGVLGSTGLELLERLESLGVEILPTEFRERAGDDSRTYASARYVRDAVLSVAARQPIERPLWFTDLDCVWLDPARAFAALPAGDEIGCIQIDYPPDWDVVGYGELALTPRALGELAASMGGSAGVAPWIGGELLAGGAGALGKLVEGCEALDARLGAKGQTLPSEQQVLSLLGALGEVRFRDLSAVARRIQTGARHGGAVPENPTALGLWHLPHEKGLSLRRAATATRHGRTARLRRDLADPVRAARRFNVQGTGLPRRIRDDSWIAKHRAYAAVRSRRA